MSPTRTQLTTIQITFLLCEGLVLLAMTIAFWYPIDPFIDISRDAWFWLLWLAVPVFILRLRVFGYLWTHSYLHDLLIIFIILSAYIYANAPFQRESYLSVMARPLSGIWMFIYFIEVTRASKSLKPVIIFITGMSSILTFFAITASAWDYSKMGFLRHLAIKLPYFDPGAVAAGLDNRICSPLVNVIHETACFNPAIMVEDALLIFHVNEMGGALSWIIPLMVSFALMKVPLESNTNQRRFWLIIRVIASILSSVMLMALFLGQSRFAIVGVFAALIFLLFVRVQNRLFRYSALAGVVIMIGIMGALLFNVFSSTDPAVEESVAGGLSERDTASMAGRFAIWEQSIRMTVDYPSTGVGMYMFRTAISGNRYSIPYSPPPHAHNEWLNIGAEMGLASLLLYLSIQGLVVWMLWQGWIKGDWQIKTLALATFTGLLAHTVYGLGDVVALWDRFHFIFWWMIGLAGSQYILLIMTEDTPGQDPLIYDAVLDLIE